MIVDFTAALNPFSAKALCDVREVCLAITLGQTGDLRGARKDHGYWSVVVECDRRVWLDDDHCEAWDLAARRDWLKWTSALGGAR